MSRESGSDSLQALLNRINPKVFLKTSDNYSDIVYKQFFNNHNVNIDFVTDPVLVIVSSWA